jgi:GTPase SAR1 family protein
LITIITKEGFIDIINSRNVIKATLNNPMSQMSILFVVFPFHLSGEVDIDRICDLIVNNQNQYSADRVTILTKYNISKGFQNAVNKRILNFNINYIGRDKLIQLIDEDCPDLWRHDDIQLLKYEKFYDNNITQENQLRRLKLPTEKCQKLLNIYINPQLYSYGEDIKTHTPIRRRADIHTLLEEKKPILLSGDSGVGKTSLLKRLGTLLIKENEKNEYKKNLPFFISAMDLLKGDLNLKTVLQTKYTDFFINGSIQELSKTYSIIILVDSIDEFDNDSQEKILKQLSSLYHNYSIKYYLGTRESEKLEKYLGNKEVVTYSICMFNIEQVKRFVSIFFAGDDYKTNNLLDALRENKIIERLPITPLTLSLISILFDETDFEIPATITDIYDNFNDLIIGKAIVSSKVEFIDISFKERVLSLYALLLMETPSHKPLSIQEFIDYFEKFFQGKTLPIKDAQLGDVLKYLIHNTGILYIKDEQWIAFSHDSYMEYYAAIEIFKFERNKERLLVERFFDVHWQNVAIFYAGKTKDMPDFAEAINKKLQKSVKWNDFISGIQGCGYLLQALYQTDNQIRKELILSSLTMVLESNNILKKMASDDNELFSNYKMPILQIMNFIHFYEMFNSITLKVPLKLAYLELKNQLDKIVSSNESDKSNIPMIGFKLLELAFTLDSKRINDQEALSETVTNNEILKDPTLNIIASFVFDLFGKVGYKEMRIELQKKYQSLCAAQKTLVELTPSKLRFSALDTIMVERKVKIFVEGITDAKIIEHAFMVLTNGRSPYWNITMASQNGQSGSSTIVTKELEAAYGYASDYNTIIGIYDHDDAGLGEYRRINKCFSEITKDSIKKHTNAEIYAITLPVPGEMDVYLQEKQTFNFFEIEHYFGPDYLKENGMVKETSIPSVLEIISSKKTKFANMICSDNNPQTFKYFLDLFHTIDSITKVPIDYVI